MAQTQPEEEVDLFGETGVPTIALLVMSRLLDDAHGTGQTLIDSYRHSYAESKATLDLVREGIDNMLNGPYMPMPHMLLAMLFPSQKDVKERAALYIKEGFSRESY
jgi:hypothetical protein